MSDFTEEFEYDGMLDRFGADLDPELLYGDGSYPDGKCRFCGRDDLRWTKTDKGPRLTENNPPFVLHFCAEYVRATNPYKDVKILLR